MARCIRNEAKFVFYGAMIAEAIVAMIWAAAAMSFSEMLEACKISWQKTETMRQLLLIKYHIPG